MTPRCVAPGARGRTAGTAPPGGEAVLGVWGELDAATAPFLRDLLERTAVGRRRVVLDLSGVSFVDAAGLGTLAAGGAKLRRQGGALVLRSPTPGLVRLLGLTGLDAVLDVEYPSSCAGPAAAATDGEQRRVHRSEAHVRLRCRRAAGLGQGGG